MKKQLLYAGPIAADTVEHLFDTDAPIEREPAAGRVHHATRARRDQRNVIVGLDIGTSKVVALVADLTPDGRLEVIGMGTHESKGLKKGVVINIEATVNAIQRAAQRQCGGQPGDTSADDHDPQRGRRSPFDHVLPLTGRVDRSRVFRPACSTW